MSEQPSIPVVEDLQAVVPEVLARAAADYATAQAANRTQEAQGGPGIREGILPGGDV